MLLLSIYSITLFIDNINSLKVFQSSSQINKRILHGDPTFIHIKSKNGFIVNFKFYVFFYFNLFNIFISTTLLCSRIHRYIMQSIVI